MDVMREAVEERAGDRGWIPGYLQVAPLADGCTLFRARLTG